MAELYGSHFEYAGVNSRTYGLIFAGVDAERFDGLASEMTGTTVYTRKYNRDFLVSNDYATPLSYEINIVSDNDFPFILENRRAIEKWLFNRGDYRKLYLDMADDVFAETYEMIDGEQKRLYLNCRFINPQRLIYNGGVIGYRATIEADSPFWWQDSVVKSFTFGSGTGEIPGIDTGVYLDIDVDSDPDDFIYPKITVNTISPSPGDTVRFEIRNATYENFVRTAFEGIQQRASIVIDSAYNFVSDQYYLKMKNRNFPRLRDGHNELFVMGDVASMTVEFSNRRFL